LSCESKLIELIKEYNESHPNVANIPEDVSHASLSMFPEINVPELTAFIHCRLFKTGKKKFKFPNKGKLQDAICYFF
jgi:hypothetical protein